MPLLKKFLKSFRRSRSASPSPSRAPSDPYAHDPRKPRPADETAKQSPPSKPAHVLLPLYIYPEPSAWDPLYAALETYPKMTFSIIVNPGSGPGPSQYPDSNYVSCVTKLHQYPNAHLLGYVSTQYAKRDQQAVQNDVAKYHDWATYQGEKGEDIHVEGIFFDEAPSQFNEHTEKYMRGISAFVKELLPAGQSHTVFNPGVICDSRFFELADEVVVCEDGYAMFGMDILRFVDACVRNKASIVVHGFNGTAEEMAEMVRGLTLEGFTGVYITTEGGYTGWGTLWDTLTKNVAKSGSGVRFAVQPE